MARNKKPQKTLLHESSIRRFMKLADIPELSESFFNEKQGYDDEEDESLGMRTGKEADKEQSEKDRRDDSYGKWGKRDETLAEEDEEAELHATEDELGAEDEVADEEAAELDAAPPAEGDAEITPEAAQAIVDLAAQLEASGAVEGAEVEAEVEDIGGELEAEEEVEDLEEFKGLEEALAGLGIEVVEDRKLNETVRKRVVRRLLKEKRAREREKTVNTLVDNIFARLQKRSKK